MLFLVSVILVKIISHFLDMFFGIADRETIQVFKFCLDNICKLTLLNLAGSVNIYEQEKPVTFDYENMRQSLE